MNDWQKASDLFMPLRLEGANLQMAYSGYGYEVTIWQSYDLAGKRLDAHRVARGVGKTLTEAMQKALELWEAMYGN